MAHRLLFPPLMTNTATLLELVTAVQDQSRSDAEVVATMAHLVGTGRVRLGASLAGPLREATPPSQAPVV